MRSLLLLFLTTCLFYECTSESTSSSKTEVTYGTIAVPENRKVEDSRTLELAYAVIPSTGNEKKNPIVFLQGGPGGSSLVMVNFFSNSPLRKNHDIILFDARGTGRSSSFCEDTAGKFLGVMAKDLTMEEEYEETIALSNACKEYITKNAIDLAGYNSRENAADLEQLRMHLEIDQWILFGGSYGTRLGLTYLRDFGNAEAAVFMGVFPPEIQMHESFMEGLHQSLDYMFKRCEEDATCADKYPDLRDEFVEIINDLNEQPLSTMYRGSKFVINSQDALLLIHQLLYQKPFIEQVPAFIMALKKGDQEVLSTGINRAAGTLSFINAAVYWSVQAYDEVGFNRPGAFQEALEKHEYLQPGPAFFAVDQRVLEQWHPYRADEIETQPVVTDTPILMVNGMFDPITPVSYPRSTLKHLPNALLVEFPNEGHSIFNPCFFELFEEFVKNDYKSIRSSCVDGGSMNWR